MKKILVPTDFSECANNAIDFAVQSAKIFRVDIMLMHSFEVRGVVYADYMGVNKEFNRTMIGDAEKKLLELKNAIKEKDEINVNIVVETKALQESIAQITIDRNADMVVMGTIGATGLKKKLWGSRTSALIGNTSIPVMVIPNEYEWKKPRKILFATNNFERDPAILNCLFELANLYMAQVEVAVFTDEVNDRAVSYVERNREIPRYEKYLRETYHDESINTLHLFGKEFDETMQQFISDNEIDMLAMVTYQRGFWDRIFNPSFTKRMSYHTTIPLLVIPAVKNDTE